MLLLLAADGQIVMTVVICVFFKGCVKFSKHIKTDTEKDFV
jgi:hypothetical protein